MKFFDDTKPLYLETDASRIGLGVALLQPMTIQPAKKAWHQTTQIFTQLHLPVKV